MSKDNGLTRREVMLLGLSSVAFAGGVSLVSMMGRKIGRLQKVIDKHGLDKIDALARACHSRWQHNERYGASLCEVRQWVMAIVTHEEIDLPPEFYCAIIDLETGGDPTCYLPSDGKSSTRGLGCVSYHAAKDVVRIYDLPIKAIGTALWNPHFNIYCLVKCVEQSYNKCPDNVKDKLHWCLYCYNSGEGNAKRTLRKKGRLPTSYYKRHRERFNLIRALTEECQR